MNKKAFTLVELIVVITILAILGTIGFTTYTNYTSEARDSARLADLSSIKKAIDMYEINSSRLPDVTGAFSVLSGTQVLFTQGTFGDLTVSSIKGLISEIPKDPVTGNPYSYSLTFDRTEYELGGFIENEKLSYNPVSKANAGTSLAQSILRGSYNGQFVKVLSGDNVKIFALPSITISTDTITEIQEIASQNLFVYDSFYNLPVNFINTKYNINGSNTNTFLNSENINVYDGNLDDLNLDSNQLTFLTNLQNAYIGTDVSSKFIINKLLEQNVSNPESLKYVKLLLNSLVSNKISMN